MFFFLLLHSCAPKVFEYFSELQNKMLHFNATLASALRSKNKSYAGGEKCNSDILMTAQIYKSSQEKKDSHLTNWLSIFPVWKKPRKILTETYEVGRKNISLHGQDVFFKRHEITLLDKLWLWQQEILSAYLYGSLKDVHSQAFLHYSKYVRMSVF